MGKAIELRAVLVSSSLAFSCIATPAWAAPPGNWSIAVERLFGLTHTMPGLDSEGLTQTSFSLLSKVNLGYGYSAPRLAFDYLSTLGLTVGGALGVQFGGNGNSSEDSAWLFVLRAGYFLSPSASFGVWPRAGFTALLLDYGTYSETATALTLEVPLELLVSGGLALTATPHADIGLGSSQEDSELITELGVQFGAGVFF